MDDISLLLTLAERHPYLAGVVAVVCALGVAVVALAQVYPSEDWCRAHPRLFAVLRLCRAVAPWLLKAADRLREARSTPLAQAAIARAFDKAAPTPVPRPVIGTIGSDAVSPAPEVAPGVFELRSDGAQDRPTEPPTDAPDTDPSPPSLGGNARRTLARLHTLPSLLTPLPRPPGCLGGVAVLSRPRRPHGNKFQNHDGDEERRARRRIWQRPEQRTCAGL